jgi:hypothetical protein
MECSICLDSIKNIYVTCITQKNEGIFHDCMMHSFFCVSCFMDWIDRTSFLCLYCRHHNANKRYTISKIYHSIKFGNTTSDDSTCCPMGCPWIGHDIDSHWRNECSFRIVDCNRCGESMLSKNRKDHDRYCKRIRCPVPDCSFQHVFSLTEEQVECAYFYPIFFFFHYVHTHASDYFFRNHCRYTCRYRDNGCNGLEYCTFQNSDRVMIQRFELDEE